MSIFITSLVAFPKIPLPYAIEASPNNQGEIDSARQWFVWRVEDLWNRRIPIGLVVPALGKFSRLVIIPRRRIGLLRTSEET